MSRDELMTSINELMTSINESKLVKRNKTTKGIRKKIIIVMNLI